MAEDLIYATKENLKRVSDNMKVYVDSDKTVSIKSYLKINNTWNFYNTTAPTEETAPIFSIDIPAEYFLDQTKTSFVQEFAWSDDLYTGSVNPNLEGKPVLVMAVKGDDNTVTYSFVNVERLIDIYTGENTKSISLTVGEDNKITANVNISEAEGNILAVKEDGIYATVEGVFKTYKSLDELGLTAPVRVKDITNAMKEGTEAYIDCTDVSDVVTDLPENGTMPCEVYIRKHVQGMIHVEAILANTRYLGDDGGTTYTWQKVATTDTVLSLAGGTMAKNANIIIPSANLVSGITLEDDVGYTATLTPDCLHIIDEEYNTTVVGASSVNSPSYNGLRINKDEGFIYGDNTDGGSETRYGDNCIDSINKYEAFFGLNLWSNGGDIDHNMYCYQSDSFYAELYTGQPDLGNANAMWRNVYAETSQITTSDRNEKTDITPLNEKVKEFVMGLNPSSYKLINGTSDRKHYGLVAQDVEKLMTTLGMDSKDFAGFIKSPKYITKEEEYTVETTVESINKETGKIETHIEPIVKTRRVKELVEGENVYSLRYEEFIAPIIKIIQMQQQEINELKAIVEELRDKVQ